MIHGIRTSSLTVSEVCDNVLVLKIMDFAFDGPDGIDLRIAVVTSPTLLPRPFMTSFIDNLFIVCWVVSFSSFV